MNHIPLQRLLPGLWLAIMLISAYPTLAHANLQRSEPAANTTLDQSPTEVRLWFTEEIDPDYSRIVLLDQQGERVQIGTAQVDEADSHQFYSPLNALADGLYTISWRVVSRADGHPTEGSFTFGVGVSAMTQDSDLTADESVAIDSILIRLLHLLSMSLLLGTIAFKRFVCYPLEDKSIISHQILGRTLMIAWGAAGLVSILMLMLRASAFLDVPIVSVLSNTDIIEFTLSSDFGRLWLMRMTLWLMIGGLLSLAKHSQHTLMIGLVLAFAMLFTHSLYSHLATAPDALAAVIGTWMHLLLASIWIGGLIAFLIVLYQIRHADSRFIGRLVAHFSNYVRVAVIGLFISGLYSTWLLVGSVDALVSTLYGRALLVKLVLFIPLLVLAAINLFITQSRLNNGQSIWVGRLRGLISAELILTLGILFAVALMTSAPPARGIQAQRDAIAAMEAAAPPDNDYMATAIVSNQTIELSISPGQVGSNTFTLTTLDSNNQPINDATLVRLRFENQDQSLGESDLELTYAPALNAYTADSNHLSIAGNWHIRATIQRPGEFDTIADFEFEPMTVPIPTLPTVDEELPTLDRTLIAGLTGLALLAAGGFYLAQKSFGQRVVALLCLLSGTIFLLTSVSLVANSGTLHISDAWARPTGEGMPAAVYFTLQNNTPNSETLISSEATIADYVEFHETSIDDDFASMDPLENFVIPAGEALRIEPAGYHLMLINLHQDISDGDTFPITLNFASGKVITLEVSVRWDQ